ncbi:MAG: imidazole glycerol phosphate synthase subunit HisH [bacterium]|nr:imidazole glycerol phosphate synthase subunit HisH [bacterium]
MKIVIVDYGVGNLKSVRKAFGHLGFDAVVSKDPAIVAGADLMVLPGQGAFGTAMTHLEQAGMVDVVKAHIAADRPFLGICVGFQLLFEGSDEKGSHKGLGVLPGTLRHFDGTHTLKVPHMGWNNVSGPVKEYHRHYYFVHSYFVPATGAKFEAGVCEYGVPFVAIAQKGKLLACQFHPEKSGDAGMDLLRAYLSCVSP